MSITKNVKLLMRKPELILSTLICAFGFLIQFSLLTNEFMKREITFDYKLSFDENMTIPYVTFCSKVSFLVNFERLFKEKRKLFGSVCNGVVNRTCLRDKTIQDKVEKIFEKHFDMDTITQYLPKGLQLIKNVQFGESFDNYLGKNCSIIDHLLFPEFCHTIICRDGNEPSKCWRGNYGVGLIHSLMKIRLNTGNLDDCYFRVIAHSSEHKTFVTPISSGVRVPSLRTSISFHEISMTRTFLERLPYPYETKCQPISLSKELDDCLNNNFIRKFHTPCPFRFIHPRKYLGRHLNLTSVGFVMRNSNRFGSTFAECLSKLPNECKSVNYDIKLHSSENIEDSIHNKNRELNVIILTPLEQDTTMFAIPKLPWSNYLIGCGSIFGSWFGLSIFNIASHLLCSTRRFIKRESKKVGQLMRRHSKPPTSRGINRHRVFVTSNEFSKYMYM